jgi:hypothetical protein
VRWDFTSINRPKHVSRPSKTAKYRNHVPGEICTGQLRPASASNVNAPLSPTTAAAKAPTTTGASTSASAFAWASQIAEGLTVRRRSTGTKKSANACGSRPDAKKSSVDLVY